MNEHVRATLAIAVAAATFRRVIKLLSARSESRRQAAYDQGYDDGLASAAAV